MQFGMPALIEIKDLEETALLCNELGLENRMLCSRSFLIDSNFFQHKCRLFK